MSDAQSAENETLLSRITMCRLGYAKGTETEEILYQAHNEIERLQNIQRDFHNLDDVAEIRRLRQAVRLYVRSKKEGLGRNALDWWRLQEIEKESAADVSGDA